MWSSHPSLGGASGMKSQSAPEASADTKARYLEKQYTIKKKNDMLWFYFLMWFYLDSCVTVWVGVWSDMKYFIYF